LKEYILNGHLNELHISFQNLFLLKKRKCLEKVKSTYGMLKDTIWNLTKQFIFWEEKGGGEVYSISEIVKVKWRK